MSITPMSPHRWRGDEFKHGSILDGKTEAAWVNSQWKSTLWVLGVPGTTEAGQGNVIPVILTALGSIILYVLLMILLAILGTTGLLARLSRSRVRVSRAAMIALVVFLLVQGSCFALMFAIYG